MKKFAFILLLLPFLTMGQTTLVTWNFPNNPDDAVADGGIPANTGMEIKTGGGTSAISFSTTGATTNSASATVWTSGSGTKYWQIKLVTTGYGNLQLSSKQYGSNTGPRQFKVQYSADYASNWIDVPGADVTVAGDWISGVLNNIPLPPACDNLDTLYIRWIMASDSAVLSPNLVASTGTNRMDDIIITGQPLAMNPAAKLYIVAVNGGVDAYANAPFDVLIHALDSVNNIANVASNTDVVLSLVTGSGNLGGNLSGTILSGTSAVTIPGVTYDTDEIGVRIQAADLASFLSPDTSSPFTVLPAAPQMYCDSLLFEDFSDGDITSNPVWTGDVSKFTVSADTEKWLMLNDLGGSGISALSTVNNIPISYDTIFWEFKTQINWNTSTQNNARFYLMSDSSDLNSALNGYYVQLGGLNDSISLCRQDGGASTILLRDQYVYTGTSNNVFRVKVRWICSTNEWTLYSDNTGGTSFLSSGSAIDGTYLPSSRYQHLGVYCRYTSTTGDKYFFDDIQVYKCGDCCLPQLISSPSLTFNLGDSLQLSATAIPGASYAWTGPGGFSSNDQNPVVSGNATLSLSGTYIVTATLAECGSITDSVTVEVLEQLCDDFSDGDFTSNFTWTDMSGDIHFVVSPTFQLQSNGPNTNGNTVADDIILVTEPPFASVNNMVWSFLIDLKFNPTNDNWVRVYLASNVQDIRGAVNGYYIHLGQTNEDYIQFYRTDGGVSTLLFTGATPFSGNVKVRLRIFKTLNDGSWNIQADPAGGFDFVDEGSGFFDNTYSTASYFGIYCSYKTDSRYNQYFFDDFCFWQKSLLGVEESNEGDQNIISIYPNPASDKITVELLPGMEHPDNIISIYNMQGQLMWRQDAVSLKTEISIGSFPRGMYYIRLSEGGNTGIARKFIRL